ncbi:nicotinamide riboside transporter PnuC [Muribaculaceae bacterium Isolate-002 (NCI)]|nr:nicotinamide riboside transporter PnuC [Muribaculaceae bacterium Isolate-002 (NCI)]
MAEHAIEIIGLVLGLFYLYFEYHASIWVWLFSLLMPMVSMIVYFDAGLYADFSINIYYLLASAYGLARWRGNKRRKGATISHIPPAFALVSIAAMLVIWLGIYLVLHSFTNSNVPVMDSLTTALSIVGTWMLARKYIEQWAVWIVVDAICVGLYIYKEIPFYAVLYAVYTVVAVFGYRKWRAMMSAQA